MFHCVFSSPLPKPYLIHSFIHPSIHQSTYRMLIQGTCSRKYGIVQQKNNGKPYRPLLPMSFVLLPPMLNSSSSSMGRMVIVRMEGRKDEGKEKERTNHITTYCIDRYMKGRRERAQTILLRISWIDEKKTHAYMLVMGQVRLGSVDVPMDSAFIHSWISVIGREVGRQVGAAQNRVGRQIHRESKKIHRNIHKDSCMKKNEKGR